MREVHGAGGGIDPARSLRFKPHAPSSDTACRGRLNGDAGVAAGHDGHQNQQRSQYADYQKPVTRFQPAAPIF